ncbi:MAG: hypothetical protein KIH64_006320 [Mycobacterium sp.]|nr:hypothetical protein [Mycobacterium sp.]
MQSQTTWRRTAVAAGSVALLSMGMLGACATKEKPATPTQSPPSATAPPSPSEKSVTKGSNGGSNPGNSFAPSVKAPPAPTALPGNVITGG